MTGTIEGGEIIDAMVDDGRLARKDEGEKAETSETYDPANPADPSGAATLWAHKALSAGRPLPFGVEVVSRFTVAAPAEEESWRSTSR